MWNWCFRRPGDGNTNFISGYAVAVGDYEVVADVVGVGSDVDALGVGVEVDALGVGVEVDAVGVGVGVGAEVDAVGVGVGVDEEADALGVGVAVEVDVDVDGLGVGEVVRDGDEDGDDEAGCVGDDVGPVDGGSV